MKIGELSCAAAVAPSAIRYYETLGLLGAPARASGRRVYTESALFRLAFIASAREVGFTLKEIRRLIGGFSVERWKPLAERKLRELEAQEARIREMKGVLREALACACLDVETCGRAQRERRRGVSGAREAGRRARS